VGDDEIFGSSEGRPIGDMTRLVPTRVTHRTQIAHDVVCGECAVCGVLCDFCAVECGVCYVCDE
jgi:hypothetical protein